MLIIETFFLVMPQSEDVTTLFEGKTIQEILAIEQSTRTEIEKKKENLRQMVGERYRDIIDAADTIRDMKSNAEKVKNNIVIKCFDNLKLS